ncbi:hypothetical protein OAK75_00135 [Bacteriovoracales bacterium]|nr:hypothetical protein [Bacteriovoracales bacterium]
MYFFKASIENNRYLKYFLFFLLGGIYLFITKFKGFYTIYSNQETYFLHGLSMANKGFLVNDWYVHKVFHHHFAFGYIVLLMEKLGGVKTWVHIFQFLCMGMVSYGIYLIANSFSKLPSLVWLITLSWIGFVGPGDFGLGWQQVFVGYLMPSEVSGGFLVFGFGLLFSRSYFLAGLSLGLGGLFHGAHLASFALPILGASFECGVWKNKKNFFKFCGPFTFLWGIFSIIVIYKMLTISGGNDETMATMVNFRNKGDLQIEKWGLWDTLAWHMWILPALFISKLNSQKIFFRNTLVITFVFCLINILQISFLKIDTITAMMLWRSASLASLLSIIIISDKLLESIFNKEALSTSLLIILSLSAAFLVWYAPSNIRIWWLLSFPLLYTVGHVRLKYNWLKLPSITSLTLIFFSLVILRTFSIGLKKTKITQQYPEDSVEVSELYKWINNNSEKDSMFIIPLDLKYFRYRANRSIVIDWKSVAQLKGDISNWYERVRDVLGLTHERVVQEVKKVEYPNDILVKKSYNMFNWNRAEYIGKKYGANFLVVYSKDHQGNLPLERKVFENRGYRVYKIN